MPSWNTEAGMPERTRRASSRSIAVSAWAQITSTLVRLSIFRVSISQSTRGSKRHQRSSSATSPWAWKATSGYSSACSPAGRSRYCSGVASGYGCNWRSGKPWIAARVLRNSTRPVPWRSSSSRIRRALAWVSPSLTAASRASPSAPRKPWMVAWALGDRRPSSSSSCTASATGR